MSFDYMTVTVTKGAEGNEVFHSVDLTPEVNMYSFYDYDGSFFSGLDTIIERVEEAGYEISSMVVHYDGYWEHEALKGDVSFAEALEFFELLCEENYQTGSILAWLTENNMSDLQSWKDSSRFEGDYKEDIAMQWFNESEMPSLYKEVAGRYGESKFEKLESLPSILCIDWNDTLDNIQANEGMSVIYLNGTWYMFS